MEINILLPNNEKSGWILCINPLQILKPNNLKEPCTFAFRKERNMKWSNGTLGVGGNILLNVPSPGKLLGLLAASWATWQPQSPLWGVSGLLGFTGSPLMRVRMPTLYHCKLTQVLLREICQMWLKTQSASSKSVQRHVVLERLTS